MLSFFRPTSWKAYVHILSSENPSTEFELYEVTVHLLSLILNW